MNLSRKKIVACLIVSFIAWQVGLVLRGLFLPSFRQVRAQYASSDFMLLDRHGATLQSLRVDFQKRRLAWVDLQAMSENFVDAVVHSEDARFRWHAGVDWLSIGYSLIQNRSVTSRQPRGASTITMQTVAMLNPALQKGVWRKTLSQKILQILDAGALEVFWSKDQILEAYANLVYFRGELQGIHTASNMLLHKDPSGINAAEALLLARLIHSPNASLDKVKAGACKLGQRMQKIQTCQELDEAWLKLADPSSSEYANQDNLAPHVARSLAKAGLSTVTSTLDAETQKFAQETLRQQLAALQAQNVLDGAVLVVENNTGNVLAYVGNSGRSETFYVDGVQTYRQAASTLKPFLYTLAFDQKVLTPESLIDDSAIEIAFPGGMYRPQNYDRVFYGLVPAKQALASSMNVPAVKVLNLLGVDTFLELFREFEMKNLRSSDFYGPSLALGTLDVTLWALTNAYRSLANQGEWSTARLTEASKRETKRIFSPQAAFLVSEILSNSLNRSITFGLDSVLVQRSWVSAKTGTSKDMRDNWCVGFSDRYTVGVWVGNFNGDSMWDVSGIDGAAPIFGKVMTWLHRDSSSQFPRLPTSIVQVAPGRFFISGTEPASSSHFQPKPIVAKILHPTNQTLIAWDPDIPSRNQIVPFEATSYDGKTSWMLDQRVVGPASRPYYWKVRPGKHVLSLLGKNNETLDEVEFTVKGGQVQKN